MASLRRLKKDITYVVEGVATDALLAVDKKKANNAEIDKLVDTVLELEEEFYDRANNPNGKEDKKLVKKHYTELKKDFAKQVDEICNKLSELVK